MWPTELSFQEIVDLLNALGVVILVVNGAVDVARKVRERRDRGDDDQG